MCPETFCGRTDGRTFETGFIRKCGVLNTTSLGTLPELKDVVKISILNLITVQLYTLHYLTLVKCSLKYTVFEEYL